MYQILSYIKFLLSSTNQHGVHSPFIYDFVTKCLYDKKKYSDYSKLSNYRNNLLKNNNYIEITDFGSGSRVFKSNNRAIKQIAKTSGTPQKRAKLFYRLTQYFKPKNTLELGTSLGIATYAMALGNTKNKITSIEGCPNISKFSKSHLDLENISIVNGEFKTIIPTLKENKFDLIFFDGHHSKDATIQYFETLLPKAHNDSVFIFDDIYWSKGMTEAWEFIKAHQAVTVTVDCFHLGFVFFRKEQVREHFIIRL
ncbi:O-methyltransferase [Winogradskyella sp.]|jgi:predicted O-methyltransferase YrrM|uniref:O-methyltransferase n=1 Tax=Winogradskyella sp. TaxID=1883156 RepID=UPI0025D5B23F|nr:class I SAM-dependent methyltransferase [Winogradskyella sp.]MCT4628379.1 class I SAM-dependent methyltransferase [Winogradskyella sp.]